MLVVLVIALEVTRNVARTVATTCDKAVASIITHEVRDLTGFNEEAWTDDELRR